MKEKKEKKEIEKALLSKALGCTTQEIIEEYGLSGEEFILQKRKTSTKSYPPDLSALQLLLDSKEISINTKYASLSNEELEKEKIRLIKLLEEKNETS
ncbi:MAG: hypothetical protein ACI4PF_00785 [Christensenellales bacterium]